MEQQLILAKRLYIEATAFSGKGDPFSAGISISMLQDSIELYVWTLIKEKQITVRDKDGFVLNLETLQKSGVVIPFAAGMLELNKARVGFKHFGILPASQESLKYSLYVEEFLKEAMLSHFSVDFEKLSLVSLIANAEIREQLKCAEAKIDAGDYVNSAIELAKAKNMVFAQVQEYLPAVGGHLAGLDSVLKRIDGVRDINIFRELERHLSTMREAILISMFQIPVDDYRLLKPLPAANKSIGGAWLIDQYAMVYTEEFCRKALGSIVKICQAIEAKRSDA